MDHMATDAQGRLLSEDGNYYWDGSNWQLVDTTAGTGLQQSEAGSQDAHGRLLSEDGNYYLDGSNWQLVSSTASDANATAVPHTASSEALQQAWQEGYVYGQQNPADSSPTPPSPYSDDTGKAWQDGVLAGQQNPQVNPPMSPAPEEESLGTVLAPKALEVGHAAWEIAHGAGIAGATMLGLLVELIIDESPPSEQATDPEVLARWFREQCEGKNITDAYMAYCQNTQVGHQGGSDALFAAGWWHGDLYTGDYASATNEAAEHLQGEPSSGGQTGVMHYSTATPNSLDMSTMELQSQ
jgi:hypothetical protein